LVDEIFIIEKLVRYFLGKIGKPPLIQQHAVDLFYSTPFKKIKTNPGFKRG